MAQPTCCKEPSWVSELDLGEAGGFDYLLGRCDRCGTYTMNVFCVVTGITGYEPVTVRDLEKMKSLGSGPELKVFMRQWGEENM